MRDKIIELLLASDIKDKYDAEDKADEILSLLDVVWRSEQLINFTKEVVDMYEKYDIGDEDIYKKAKAIIN